MATTVDRLLLELDIQFKNLALLDKQAKKIEKLFRPKNITDAVNKSMKGFDDVNAKLTNFGSKGTKSIFNVGKAMDHSVNKSITQMGKSITKATNEANGRMKNLQAVMLQVGLSMLFTGMAIKRFFEGMLRSLFQTFLMVEGEGGIVNDKMNELQATLAFLKFSLMDAFVESGALDVWIERIESLIDWFNGLDDSTKSLIVSIMIWGAIIGTVMMVAGQAVLGFLGLLALIEFIGAPVFFGIAIAIALIIALFLIWNSDMSTTEKVLWTIVIVLVAIAAAILLFVGISALPWIIIALGVAFVIGWFAKLVKRMGGVGEAFKVVGLFVLWVLALIGDGIIEFMIAPIRIFIGFLNLAIRAFNKLSGENMSLIKTPEELAPGMLTRKAEGFAKSVIARSDAQRAPAPEPVEEETTEGFKDKVTNVFNIEGIISEDSMDGLMSRINESSGFNSGSPQG